MLEHFTDSLDLGGLELNDTMMILVQAANVSFTHTMGLGVSAHGPNRSMRTNIPYPTVLDEMFEQRLINTRAFSLYLNQWESTEYNILFGGIDTALYEEPMWTFEMDYSRPGYFVTLTGLTQGGSDRWHSFDDTVLSGLLLFGPTDEFLLYQFAGLEGSVIKEPLDELILPHPSS
jgi:hypothetical protein